MLNRRNLTLVGVVVFALAAYISGGHHHPDEHFQILEFADYKLGITAAHELPWEFREQIRPGLQPFLVYLAGSCWHACGFQDPFVLSFLLRLCLAALNLFCFVWLSRLLAPDFKQPNTSNILLGLSIFVWYMPYIAVRFSSENGSAALFLAGIAFLMEALRRSGKLDWRWPIAGLLFGLSFFMRYQIGFALVGVMAWLVLKQKSDWRSLALFAVGGLAGGVIGLSADYWLYGSLVWTPWNYFRSNVLEGRMLDFGISPWWFYFPEYIVRAVPPVSLVLLGFLAWGIYKKPGHLFTWFIVPFVLAHIVIKHKEMRFLFPMAYPMLFLVAVGWEALWENIKRPRLANGLLKLTLVINGLLLLPVLTRPALDCLPCYKYLYYEARKRPLVLYAEKESPYLLAGLHTHFYDPPNLTVVLVDQFADLADTSCYTLHPGDLLLHRRLTLPPIGPGIRTERVFAGLPDWVLQFEFGGWQERSRVWSVYEVMRDER